jgi:hypothetical protein
MSCFEKQETVHTVQKPMFLEFLTIKSNSVLYCIYYAFGSAWYAGTGIRTCGPVKGTGSILPWPHPKLIQTVPVIARSFFYSIPYNELLRQKEVSWSALRACMPFLRFQFWKTKYRSKASTKCMHPMRVLKVLVLDEKPVQSIHESFLLPRD